MECLRELRDFPFGNRRSFWGNREGLRCENAARELIAKIADNLSEFLIQRELAGIPHENLEWILKTYDIPEEILARLGLRRGE
jgi:hypothetical protein